MKKEHESVTYQLPREALSRLDLIKQLIEAASEQQTKGACGMSDEMVKRLTREHEQQPIHSPNH